MKNTALLWIVFLALPACQKIAKPVSKDKWADYRKGYALLSNHPDSAFFYFNRAASNSENKEVVALAYYNMALIQVSAGDDYGAQESLIMSEKSLDEHGLKDRSYLASDYNELGMTCYNLNEFRDALNYYQQALRFADNQTLKPYILNNIGNAYSKLQAYQQAVNSYQKVIDLVGKNGASYARTLTNLATTKWLRNHKYNAVPELLTSLAIRLRQKDRWGENSSYAHLADFYLHSQPDSALYYAKKMFAIANRLQSPDDELEALRKLIVLSPPDEAKTYFRHYQVLSDSIETSRNAAKNQFALIRYNVEKSKAENIQLQKENTEKKYQLVGVLVVTAFILLLLVFWYRKRKQRLQIEANNRIRQNELRLSQKVHDVVANGLYQVISGIENTDELRKDTLLDQIETLYEQSRNISYEKTGFNDGDFSEKVARLLTGFGNPITKIAVIGNNAEIWESVGAHAREQLEQVLLELMVNMKKHSQATRVAVRFEHDEHNLVITYFDNGKGFPLEAQFGNGLTNTGNRIQQINGEITFDSTPHKGIKINITVPLN